jgi:transcriptional regulator with XRE-family HTH domain
MPREQILCIFLVEKFLQGEQSRMTPQEFGVRFRRLREWRGFDQLAFALAAGYKNASAISKIEKGRTDVQLSSLLTFADVLDIPIAVFFLEDDTCLKIPPARIEDLRSRAASLENEIRTVLVLYAS